MKPLTKWSYYEHLFFLSTPIYLYYTKSKSSSSTIFCGYFDLSNFTHTKVLLPCYWSGATYQNCPAYHWFNRLQYFCYSSITFCLSFRSCHSLVEGFPLCPVYQCFYLYLTDFEYFDIFPVRPRISFSTFQLNDWFADWSWLDPIFSFLDFSFISPRSS